MPRGDPVGHIPVEKTERQRALIEDVIVQDFWTSPIQEMDKGDLFREL